jgi:hypothetical protein
MTTYLLTWNPARWPWTDLVQCIEEVRRTGHYRDRWGCGRNRRIVEGDRVFLIRQGVEPRGIIGSGHAVSEVYDDQHWDDAERAMGRRTLYVDVEFDVLLDAEHEPIFGRDRLNEGRLASIRWDVRASGVLVPDEVARELEAAWIWFLKSVQLD